MKDDALQRWQEQLEEILSKDVDNEIEPTSLHSEPEQEMTFEEKLKQKTIELKETEIDKLKVENRGLELDNDLKEQTLKKLFLFLGAETIIVFVITFFQGFNAWDFELEEWSFKLLLSATIIQIVYMLTIAVSHLFPQKKGGP